MNATMIPLNKLEADAATNPRSRENMNQDALQDLVDSIAQAGVLQPVLVRPAGGGYLVVAGHRRVEAARQAGLTEIPAMVREMTDAEAVDAAMVENLIREDLPPVDEAEGYRAWVAAGQTVDEIALKVGRSKSHVYGRMKLLDLPEEALRAVRSGELTLATAVMIGRLPSERQRQSATDEVLMLAEAYGHEEGDPISHAKATDLISRKFMTALETAPFDVNDPDLVPASGACGACRHRSGNQVDLFGDVVAKDGDDVCTYPECFESKKAAHSERIYEAARTAGHSILTDKQCAKTFSSYGGVAWNAPFVACDSIAPGSKKTLREKLGKKAPKEFVGVDPLGAEHHLYKVADVDALKAAKAKKAPAAKLDSSSAASGPDEDDIYDEVMIRVREILATDARGLLATAPGELVRFLLWTLRWSDLEEAVKRRGVQLNDHMGSEDAYIETLTTEERWGLYLEARLIEIFEEGSWNPGELEERMFAVARALNFKIGDLQQAAIAKLEAASAAEQAPEVPGDA